MEGFGWCTIRGREITSSKADCGLILIFFVWLLMTAGWAGEVPKLEHLSNFEREGRRDFRQALSVRRQAPGFDQSSA